MIILVVNSGSSSLKYRLYDMAHERELDHGTVEHLDPTGEAGSQREQALRRVFEATAARHPIAAVGHRVVHGGGEFRKPVRVDDTVLERLRRLDELAPLHNPACRLGIETALAVTPGVPQVAVFDTGYFASLPEKAWRYALPRELADTHGIRRYGFHGISHEYVAQAAAGHLRRPLDELRLITLHLGNGASASAIDRGRCVDTSMGMTPLEGLVMGSRSGDVDPAIVCHLQRRTGMDADNVEELLNRQSGLLGLCGEADMRAIRRRAEAGDGDARLAIDIFCHRLRKYIGAYGAVLGGLDALVFTGGMGEHDAALRGDVCGNLGFLGIALDPDRNAEGNVCISPDGAAPAVLVVPTNEELAIARATARCLGAAPAGGHDA
ncbi:MAG: acetate kinase [Gammaproteobacteria bacterium]|nr:acetate kinase [Gammaproteobacteria bacterium]